MKMMNKPNILKYLNKKNNKWKLDIKKYRSQFKFNKQYLCNIYYNDFRYNCKINKIQVLKEPSLYHQSLGIFHNKKELELEFSISRRFFSSVYDEFKKCEDMGGVLFIDKSIHEGKYIIHDIIYNLEEEKIKLILYS